MIVKYGTPAPAEIVDVKNIPAWVKQAPPSEKEKSKEKEAPKSEKDEE